MGWQKEFVETFYEVVKQENIVFSRFNKNMNNDEWIPHNVVALTERQWQYLLYKGLLDNKYFNGLVIQLEESYSNRKHAEPRKRHADFMLSKIKYGKPNYNSTICIEMKRVDSGLKEAKKDYDRLTNYSVPSRRGLLIYQFSENPVDLVGKINESAEFSRKRFKMAASRDIEMNVVSVGGNPQKYHFEAVLLSW